MPANLIVKKIDQGWKPVYEEGWESEGEREKITLCKQAAKSWVTIPAANSGES